MGHAGAIIAGGKGTAAEKFAALEAAGAKAVYVACDVRDKAGLKKALGKVQKDLGPITTLIHGAGVLADRKIEDKTDEQFAAVFSTKVESLLILNELLLNAVKHRSDPAAAVRVSLRKADAADRVRVTISNAGTWRAAPSEGQIGLSLVDSLMPRSGAPPAWAARPVISTSQRSAPTAPTVTYAAERPS